MSALRLPRWMSARDAPLTIDLAGAPPTTAQLAARRFQLSRALEKAQKRHRRDRWLFGSLAVTVLIAGVWLLNVNSVSAAAAASLFPITVVFAGVASACSILILAGGALECVVVRPLLLSLGLHNTGTLVAVLALVGFMAICLALAGRAVLSVLPDDPWVKGDLHGLSELCPDANPDVVMKYERMCQASSAVSAYQRQVAALGRSPIWEEYWAAEAWCKEEAREAALRSRRAAAHDACQRLNVPPPTASIHPFNPH